jgi:hypothetical protein
MVETKCKFHVKQRMLNSVSVGDKNVSSSVSLDSTKRKIAYFDDFEHSIKIDNNTYKVTKYGNKVSFYKNDRLHREDGPAKSVLFYNKIIREFIGNYEWWKDGVLYRRELNIDENKMKEINSEVFK